MTTHSKKKMVNPLVIEPLGKHTASIIFSQLRLPLRSLCKSQN